MRLIGVTLLIFFIGFLYVNSHSSSHAQLSHSHQAELDHHHNSDHQESGLDAEHTHPHDPLDHTHDIPLRMTVVIPVASTFFRGWLSSSPLPFHSAFLLPLERPPKSPLTV